MEFIRIENVNTWKDEIKRFYPGTPKHIQYWRELKKRCIEGIWRKDFDQYRYMPGSLYFSIHFFTLVDFDKKRKVNVKIRPKLWDIMWEYHYLNIACSGFSGFEDDDEYTCYRGAQNIDEDTDFSYWPESALKKDGGFKKYMDPFMYVRQRFDKPMGRPLYENNSMDAMILGSRGGSKSYTGASLCAYNLLFDSAKYYDADLLPSTEQKKTMVSEVFVASAKSSKSHEMLKKMQSGLEEMQIDLTLGKFEGPSHPFSKNFQGSIKENNIYQHKYSYKDKDGSYTTFAGSYLSHKVVTIENPEASAGGRYTFSLIEEVGLIPNVIDFKGSHEATLYRGGVRFGYTMFIGTAGNMKKIQQAREMFLNPRDYNIYPFIDTYEYGTEIGFFLPVYYTDAQFKDKNGNTDVEKAKEHYLKRREKLKKNAKALLAEFMNYPMNPSEMWITSSFNVFPTEEAKKRETYLTANQAGQTVDLHWKDENTVGWTTNSKQICPYPFRTEDNPEGTIVIYDHPLKVNVSRKDHLGNERSYYETPKDMYVISLDPYATDSEKDSRNSLGAAYVMLNPKYYDHPSANSLIVASYVARPSSGRRTYLENLEKLIAYYGNPIEGLWYENDRGDHVKDYFEKKNKLKLLAIDRASAQNIRGRVTRYGWNMGNQHKKLDRIDQTADFLKRFSKMQNGKSVMNIERIPDVYLLREILNYDIDSKANYDRLIGLVGCVVGINNIYNDTMEKMEKKHEKPMLEFFSKNRVLRKQRKRRNGLY